MINKRFVFILCLVISYVDLLAQTNPCNSRGAPYSSLPGDTTIILKGGTQITFNRCEFFDLRDCLDFQEMLDQESIDASGLTTMDNQGNPLLSCGMFKLNLSPDCNGKTCFEVPVRIRIPFAVNFGPSGNPDTCARCDRRGIRLFITRGSIWSGTNEPYKIIELNGRKYFEFVTNCGNIGFNCDCCIWEARTKVKFKAKNMKRLDSIIIRSSCPVGVWTFVNKRNRRTMIVRMPCTRQERLTITAKGSGAGGDPVVITSRPIGQFEHGNRKINCKSVKGKVIRRIFGIFPIREGYYYKKYLIK